MSGTRRHSVTFTVVERRPDGLATLWEARCGRHTMFFAATYALAEDAWREHVYAETGRAPKPTGSSEGRWNPPAEAATARADQ